MMFCGSQAWVEGIKEVMEPLIILLLAWALGAVIAVSYTPSYPLSLSFSLSLCLSLSLSLPPSLSLPLSLSLSLSLARSISRSLYLSLARSISLSLSQDIQTSNFISLSLRGGSLRAEYFPALTTIIGYFMAYTTGSVSDL